MTDAAIFYRSLAASQLPFSSTTNTRRSAMSRATKRRVVGTVTQLNNGNQFLCNAQWFQLADRAEERRLPTPGQTIAFDAYDYGRGIETFFRFDDANAPQAEAPARPRRSFTPAVASVPDRSFEVRRIALECASRTCREYAASALLDYARQLEAYLTGPLTEAADEPVEQQTMPAISAEQILAALQAIGAPQLVAPEQPVVNGSTDVPIRRRRSRAIA